MAASGLGRRSGGRPLTDRGWIIQSRLRAWARGIKRDVHAIYLAARDPRVPWYAKVAALCVAGHAISPVDLIPDFVPALGYLDDLVIVPLGIALVVRLIPPDISPNIEQPLPRLAKGRRAALRRQTSSRSGSVSAWSPLCRFWTISAQSSCPDSRYD